jgi:hypothetical protein
MNDCVLTVVDTSGIQSYVFGSNRLRENVGASELVLQATGAWIYETLPQIGRTNVVDGGMHHELKLEDGLAAELIYTGGGNALVLFASRPLAVRWAMLLTEKALRKAPGLNLIVAHSEPFSWDQNGNNLADQVRRLFEITLAEIKQNRIISAPLLGLGVTATCQSTGQVAVAMDAVDSIRVSTEIVRKTDALPAARKRFDSVFHDYTGAQTLDYDLPNQLDELGRSIGERSYIAVVHADGNGMGKRFQAAWIGKNNRAAILAVRRLSEAVNSAGERAMKRMLIGLLQPSGRLIEPFDANSKLPFRPLIYGGDDVTFVCDGRLGLGLAAAYLRAFEQETTALPDNGGAATAAAGVAIVKTHYPFARAYEFSETLSRNAKDELRRESSGIDWHIALSGLLDELPVLRKREYMGKDGLLVMRPLRLRHDPRNWRTWPAFEKTLCAFMEDPDWAERRNKVKQLREVLREGGTRTKQFCTVYQIDRLPGYDDVDVPQEFHRRGWDGYMCGYFDPIEALDFYIPLHGEK